MNQVLLRFFDPQRCFSKLFMHRLTRLFWDDLAFVDEYVRDEFYLLQQLRPVLGIDSTRHLRRAESPVGPTFFGQSQNCSTDVLSKYHK